MGKHRSSNHKNSEIEKNSSGQEGELDRRADKNPAAVALGRLGGQKGGKARAERLSDADRSSIARKAANARWGRK
jgi:hypothetical protein